MDWPDGEARQDFLGFAIRRTPGFQDNKTGTLADYSWLPNRIGFNGPPAEGQPDFPSNKSPIQKFLWWDARLDGLKPDFKLSYVEVILPHQVRLGIGTWFNRAVMSSQAFSRILGALDIKNGVKPSDKEALILRKWLANGLEFPVPNFISSASSIAGAIYHLTDLLWIIPSLKTKMAKSEIGLIYDAKVEKDKKTKKPKPNLNSNAIKILKKVKFFPRDKTNIMHNKYLIAGEHLLSQSGPKPTRITCGSANYTTEGLTTQANLVHTFDSPELAEVYLERVRLLKGNPKKVTTSKESGWSHTISIGDAGIRVFFSPEPGRLGKDNSQSIETIVEAIHSARSSVIFCLFMPTDEKLRQACFSVGDAGKMMFGLVNHIAREEPKSKSNLGSLHADQLARLEMYHRSKNNKDTIGAEYFNVKLVPEGFKPEINIFPGEKPPDYPPVIIHHKFIVVDAETESPVVYTGSANMSGNSVFNNDENLLEIKGSPSIAQTYLAEFLRLYEHYRARAHFIRYRLSGKGPLASGYSLSKDRSWANKHFTPGTREYKARLRMLAM